VALAPPLRGSLLVCGTTSDAGKSFVVAGLCRLLARRGVRVAPFKAQNMALNASVTADGAEIGHAQWVQAVAAGVAPEAAMNPVLLKPTSDRASQVVVMGRATGVQTAAEYHESKRALLPVVLDALADLRSRHDVVICEGAGSPAEINLLAGDIVNLPLARAAGLPAIVVGDIDRGGVFASLIGTLAALDRDDQAHVAGFLVNKFRGDLSILAPGLDDLQARTGRPTLGVLPFLEDLWLDVEDSLALDASRPDPGVAAADVLEVAVLRLRWMSNFTDVDALSAEPGVRVRFTRSAADLARADLVVIPGTKATVEDLALLRDAGLDRALRERADAGRPIFGICGGYQLLGARIADAVESGAGVVDGLGLLPVTTVFVSDKVLRRRAGHAPALGGAAAGGYEIRHGRVDRHGGEALLVADDGEPDGCVHGAVMGTSWHGALEHDALRRALLARVASLVGRPFVPGSEPFAAVRARHLDALGDLIEQHVDTTALTNVIAAGVPDGLPALTLDLQERACSVS